MVFVMKSYSELHPDSRLQELTIGKGHCSSPVGLRNASQLAGLLWVLNLHEQPCDSVKNAYGHYCSIFKCVFTRRRTIHLAHKVVRIKSLCM